MNKSKMAKTSYTFVFVSALIIAAVFSGLIVAYPYLSRLGQQVGPSPTPPPGPVGGVFAGNLHVTTQWLDHGNLDTLYEDANATVKIFHADKVTLFGTTSTGAEITGQVLTSDNGMLYMVLQPASTVYVDSALTTSANPSILGPSEIYAISGVNYYCFPLNVGAQTPLAAGEPARDITVNIYQEVADVTDLDYTSALNATSADYSETSWTTASATGYISGMTQKDAFKIAKVQMSMSDAANISLLDNGHIKQLSVTLGLGNGQTWTLSNYQHYTGGSYIDFVTGSPDQTQEYYGKLVIYGATNSASDISYSVSCQCSGFTASDVWLPSLLITYIGPDGTVGTITREVSFTDT